jgi:hypothetical protein
LSKQLTETRALVSSEGMLQLMREVEDIRRNSAALRGSLMSMQKAQSDSAAQVKNFYLDLDTRIRALKQSAAQSGPQVPDRYCCGPADVAQPIDQRAGMHAARRQLDRNPDICEIRQRCPSLSGTASSILQSAQESFSLAGYQPTRPASTERPPP